MTTPPPPISLGLAARWTYASPEAEACPGTKQMGFIGGGAANVAVGREGSICEAAFSSGREA